MMKYYDEVKADRAKRNPRIPVKKRHFPEHNPHAEKVIATL